MCRSLYRGAKSLPRQGNEPGIFIFTFVYSISPFRRAHHVASFQFGKTGNPGVDGWKPLDLNDPVYLEMGEEYKVHQGLPLRNRIDFWNSLPPGVNLIKPFFSSLKTIWENKLE